MLEQIFKFQEREKQLIDQKTSINRAIRANKKARRLTQKATDAMRLAIVASREAKTLAATAIPVTTCTPAEETPAEETSRTSDKCWEKWFKQVQEEIDTENAANSDED